VLKKLQNDLVNNVIICEDWHQILCGLYAQSKRNEIFSNLMKFVLDERNILLAISTLKTSSYGYFRGIDKKNILDLNSMTLMQIVDNVKSILLTNRGYYPKPAIIKLRKKPFDISKNRPIANCCLWDRLIQQCIKQILEPICEARFSENSYGFRQDRKVVHALCRIYNHMQLAHLSTAVNLHIINPFDNINHSKFIKQLWSFGIHDKTLIYIIKRILSTRVITEDSVSGLSLNKGITQCGLLAPLFLNIVLNELDQWIDNQWEQHPVVYKYSRKYAKSGALIKSNAYAAMRKTSLKEMHIVRYGDDIVLFFKDKHIANKTLHAIKLWLQERLQMSICDKKSKIINLRTAYISFLGFRVKLHKKKQKYTVKSKITIKQHNFLLNLLIHRAKNIAMDNTKKSEYEKVKLYNRVVSTIHNYYQFATDICVDCAIMQRRVMTILMNRLGINKSCQSGRLSYSGRKLNSIEQYHYGRSSMMRYLVNTKEPIYPVGYIRHRDVYGKKRSFNRFSIESTQDHDQFILLSYKLLYTDLYATSIEFLNNKIYMFIHQNGLCAISGIKFSSVNEIHCHHIIPKSLFGNDHYTNLLIVSKDVHKLIHATTSSTIRKYMNRLNLNYQQISQINKLRSYCKLDPITLLK
jgi:group II intron reverse transcriptase/maturase